MMSTYKLRSWLEISRAKIEGYEIRASGINHLVATYDFR